MNADLNPIDPAPRTQRKSLHATSMAPMQFLWMQNSVPGFPADWVACDPGGTLFRQAPSRARTRVHSKATPSPCSCHYRIVTVSVPVNGLALLKVAAPDL